MGSEMCIRDSYCTLLELLPLYLPLLEILLLHLSHLEQEGRAAAEMLDLSPQHLLLLLDLPATFEREVPAAAPAANYDCTLLELLPLYLPLLEILLLHLSHL